MVCRNRQGEVALYRFDEERRGTGSDMVGMAVQRARGLGDGGIVLLASWRSP